MNQTQGHGHLVEIGIMSNLTVIVPTDGSWHRAPDEMPEPGQWVLIMFQAMPAVGFANPDEFSGWAAVNVHPSTFEFEVIAGFSDEIYWSPLPAIDELRMRRGNQ